MWQSIQRNIAWRAIPFAGLVAGTVFLLTNLLLASPVLEIQPELILRYFAALVLGPDVLTDTGTSILLVGVIVHFALSIIFTLLIAIVVHRWGLLVGILGGAILGLSLYFINMYTLTVFVEWFFAINSSLLALSHVLFGAVAGGIYETFDKYDQPLIEERES